jgi:hypothetical protein
MTILNITNDGLPNVLAVLYARVLASRGGISRDELLTAVAPAEIVEDGGSQASKTLNRWSELGMFTEKDGVISAPDKPAKKPSSTLEEIALTRRVACKYALADTNNENFWATEGARSADLTRTLAWAMAQDAFNTRLSELEALEADQIQNDGRRLMRNPTRQNGYRFWAEFLGFSRQPGGDIDPTVAVRDVLDELIRPGTEIGARDFIDRLAQKLPVLDGGRWRNLVLAEVDPIALPRLQLGQISSALSRALLCLRAEGELLLVNRADTGSSIVLTGFQGVRADLTFQAIARPASGGR